MNAFFEVLDTQVLVVMRGYYDLCQATARIKVGGQLQIEAGEGEGPIEALDLAFRKILESVYPALTRVKITRFRVEHTDDIDREGAAAKVRAIIGMRYNGEELVFAGEESPNIIRSGYSALERGYNACLRRLSAKAETEEVESGA